ncbi:MAG: T9SS type A sorting domain-containing protein [Bacteroidia bacterium]|nr:T9SS type A sorting domain-containing protein [Bacteroidia bacterium]
MARAVLSAYDTLFVNRINPCEIPMTPSLRKDELNHELNQGSNTDIVIFPNPTTGMVHFKINADIYGKMEVLDLLGRPIIAINKLWQAIDSIDLNSLPNGFYHLKFTSTNYDQQWKIIVRK